MSTNSQLAGSRTRPPATRAPQNSPAPKKGRRLKVRALNTSAGRPGVPSSLVFKQYVTALMDPWENGPIRLGYDTMIPTSLATGYVRWSYTTDASDTTWAFVAHPSLTSSVRRFNTVIPGGVTTYDCSNKIAILNAYGTARVTSCGLRLTCLIPGTATPGVLFGSELGEVNYDNLSGLASNPFQNLPTTQLGFSSSAEWTSRPIDNESFQFMAQPIFGPISSSENYHASSGVVGGSGWPVGTIIWLEYVCNLETVVTEMGAYASLIDSSASAPTVSDYFPTPASMLKAAKSVLSHPVTLEVLQALPRMAGVPGSVSSIAARFGRHAAQRAYSGPHRSLRPAETRESREAKDEL